VIVLIICDFSPSAKFREIPVSKFHGKGRIPWLGSKFRGLPKTVGPTNVHTVHTRHC